MNDEREILIEPLEPGRVSGFPFFVGVAFCSSELRNMGSLVVRTLWVIFIALQMYLFSLYMRRDQHMSNSRDFRVYETVEEMDQVMRKAVEGEPAQQRWYEEATRLWKENYAAEEAKIYEEATRTLPPTNGTPKK